MEVYSRLRWLLGRNTKWVWSGNTTTTKLQTNPLHRKEEPHSNHETPGSETKQSNQLFLLHQDDCKTRMDIKQRTTKHRAITYSHSGSNNKQQVNNNRTTTLSRTDSSLSHHGIYWHQIFTLDSAVFEVQEMFSSHGSLLTIAMYHHGETLLSN